MGLHKGTSETVDCSRKGALQGNYNSDEVDTCDASYEQHKRTLVQCNALCHVIAPDNDDTRET